MWFRRHDDEIRISCAEAAANPDIPLPDRRPTAMEVARTLTEAAAIIEGTVADSAVAGWPPPRWAWVNKLAHCSWDEMCDLAQKRRRLVRIWEGAISFLAGEIEAEAGTPEGLLALQRNALIPLELAILGGLRNPPATPLELVAMVRAEIYGLGSSDH